MYDLKVVSLWGCYFRTDGLTYDKVVESLLNNSKKEKIVIIVKIVFERVLRLE